MKLEHSDTDQPCSADLCPCTMADKIDSLAMGIAVMVFEKVRDTTDNENVRELSVAALTALTEERAMSVELPYWAQAAIDAVENRPPEAALRSRYPYTYAYDFMRIHNVWFDGLSGSNSRGDCATWITNTLKADGVYSLGYKQQICEAFADAHMREYNLTFEDEP